MLFRFDKYSYYKPTNMAKLRLPIPQFNSKNINHAKLTLDILSLYLHSNSTPSPRTNP